VLTTLTVVDWRDEPVPDARVVIFRRDRFGAAVVFRGQTDVGGKVTVPPQERGPIDVSILPPPNRSDVCCKAQIPWTSERIALARGFVISGSVRNAAGAPVQAEILFRTDAEEGWGQWPTAADGKFTLLPLAYGVVSLAAVSAGFASSLQEPTWTAVTPDDPRVSLTRQGD
jgi:hypothetical protein